MGVFLATRALKFQVKTRC